ncbi:hypothetical protein NIES4073_02820 (plasmid) [Kalymmatonema gypsitolerans NIES-4073]|nr:hypothetical protein NIES4073_02820 [Scytonema sp. NIES-4073]
MKKIHAALRFLVLYAALGFLVLSVVVSPLGIQSALAFNPDEEGHLGITSEAIRGNSVVSPSKPIVSPLERVVNSVKLRFSDTALQEIRDANRSTDFSTTFLDPEKHFDNEEFFNGTTRLVEFKNYIIGQITNPFFPNGANARIALGGALHTIQDFYAHTNWVDLSSLPVIDSRLGRTTFDSPNPKSTPTSPTNDPSTLLPGLTQLTSGYFTVSSPCSAPPGKTRHGSFICPTGLNKDEPGRVGYNKARRLAVIASQDYINQILDAPGVAGNANAIRILMGI